MASRLCVGFSCLLVVLMVAGPGWVLGDGEENAKPTNTSVLQEDSDLISALRNSHASHKSRVYTKRDTSLFTTRCRSLSKICPMMRVRRCARLCVHDRMRHVCKVRLTRNGPWQCVYVRPRRRN